MGVEAFHYTADKKAADGTPGTDGVMDSDPIRSSEARSEIAGTNLPAAVYPVLSYVPPYTEHSGVKIISLNAAQILSGITVNSTESATITAVRMDTDAPLATAASATTLAITTPDFEGSLMLKITAKDAQGDTATDYIMLQKDIIAPALVLTCESFLADYTTAVYTVTGTTEAGATVEYDAVNDVGSTAFSPQTDTTRAMIWTVLYRMAGAPGKTEAPATWYADAQKWVIAEHISDGMNPATNVTREQLAVILYRYAKATAVTADMSGFSDTLHISDFATDGMGWAVASKILQGNSGKLNPKGDASRAEVAAMLQRFASLSK